MPNQHLHSMFHVFIPIPPHYGYQYNLNPVGVRYKVPCCHDVNTEPHIQPFIQEIRDRYNRRGREDIQQDHVPIQLHLLVVLTLETEEVKFPALDRL